MPVLVRAATLTNYLEVCRQLRVNPAPLLSQAGLSRALIALPDQMLPAQATINLLEATARQTQCDTIGLRMAELRNIADVGAISLVVAHQPTLRGALQIMIDYRHLLNETLMLQLEEADGLVILREEIAIGQAIASRQASELAVGVLFRLCEAMLGTHWRPEAAHFIHDTPANLEVHTRIFRCRLQFGSDFSGLVFAARDLDRPNPLANPALAVHAKRMLDGLAAASRRSVTDDTRQSITFLLPTGRATVATVAQALGMSVRTLQRRLDVEGAAFETLLNEVRRDASLRYLANPRFSLAEVSSLLGYGAQGSFTRWFQASFGVPPSRWINQKRSAPKTNNSQSCQ